MRVQVVPRGLSLSRSLMALSLGLAGLVGSNGAIGPQDTSQLIARVAGADLAYRQHLLSQIHPGMRMASFALPSPMPARNNDGGFAAPMSEKPDLDRFGRPRVTPVEATAKLVYPLVDRTRKGDYGGRPKPREIDPDITSSIRKSDDLYGPAPRLRGPQGFRLVPWTETEAGPVEDAPVNIRVASVRAFASASDLPEAMFSTVSLHLLPEGDGDLVVGTEPQERLSSAEPTGILIEGLSMIAQAGGGFGVTPLPAGDDDMAIAARSSLFDSRYNGFTAEKREAPDALARVLGQPEPGPFALASPSSRAIGFNPAHPALTLALQGASLAKAQKCLSEAVYFESRSEPDDGQVAVAQVVLNRATSGFYPNDVCGVVYQNAHRYLGCQFTFACEGKASLIPTEPEPWAKAQKIAKAMLAGQIWLPKVGNATHYHATYVRPYWVRSMKKHDHIGLHVFYRPKAWES